MGFDARKPVGQRSLGFGVNFVPKTPISNLLPLGLQKMISQPNDGLVSRFRKSGDEDGCEMFESPAVGRVPGAGNHRADVSDLKSGIWFPKEFFSESDGLGVGVEELDEFLSPRFDGFRAGSQMKAPDQHFLGNGGGEEGSTGIDHRQNLMDRASASVVDGQQFRLGQTVGDQEFDGNAGFENGGQTVLSIPKSALFVEGDSLMCCLKSAGKQGSRQFLDESAADRAIEMVGREPLGGEFGRDFDELCFQRVDTLSCSGSSRT